MQRNLYISGHKRTRRAPLLWPFMVGARMSLIKDASEAGVLFSPDTAGGHMTPAVSCRWQPCSAAGHVELIVPRWTQSPLISDPCVLCQLDKAQSMDLKSGYC